MKAAATSKLKVVKRVESDLGAVVVHEGQDEEDRQGLVEPVFTTEQALQLSDRHLAVVCLDLCADNLHRAAPIRSKYSRRLPVREAQSDCKCGRSLGDLPIVINKAPEHGIDSLRRKRLRELRVVER